MSRRRIHSFAFVVSVAWAASGVRLAGAGEIADLMAYAPDGYNAVLAIDAEALFGSRLATEEGWQAKYADAFTAAPSAMPPDATHFVLTAQFDVETMHPLWQAAVVDVAADRTVEQIAQRTGGVVDRLGSLDAVWPRDDLCIVKIAERRFGLLTPATRQAAARWARSLADPQAAAAAPLLTSTAALVDGGSQTIGFAIDLRDVLRPQEVAAAVAKSQALAGVDQGAAAAVLASVAGVRATFNVQAKITGELTAAFGEDCGVLAPAAGDLIAEVMNTAGMVLDDVEHWSFTAAGRAISGRGDAGEATLRRILSLHTLDATVVAAAEAPPAVEAAPAAAAAARPGYASMSPEDRATRKYFQGVSRYVADLQRDAGRRSPDQIAMWMDNYASRIDRLSTRDVDTDVAGFGAWVAQSLHGAVASMHQAYADTAPNPLAHTYVEAGSVPTRRSVNYGGVRVRGYAPYSRAQIDIGSAIQSQQEAEAAFAQTADQAKQILDSVFSETEKMRTQMTERFGVEF